jgi:hypothetical protein
MDVSDQLHVSSALPSGKEPRYPLDRRLDTLFIMIKFQFAVLNRLELSLRGI